MPQNQESARLKDARNPNTPWKKWGPYLSERQWGTVREDYSQDGNAWDYFTHDQARSRAYHWGEDGLAGISDDKQLLCFSVALWNGNDPILKERMFGLTNSEANHGEDVKEYYFYLDSTPTHSYMKYLYKYPQAALSLRRSDRDEQAAQPWTTWNTNCWIRASSTRIATSMYSWNMPRQAPEDILIQISVSNRGPEPATLHVLPTLWFRNTWTWWPGTPKPSLKQVSGQKGVRLLQPHTPIWVSGICTAREMSRCCSRKTRPTTSGSSARPTPSPYVKDGINNYVVKGNHNAVNPEKTGTKSAAHYQLNVGAGKTATIRLRLSDLAPAAIGDPFKSFAAIMQTRQQRGG